MSGRISRRKGHDWEREVARLYTQATGRQHARVLTESREGNVGDVRGPSPLVTQCKVGAAPNAWKALREAIEAAGPGEHPVAVLRRNGIGRKPAVDVAVLPLKAWLEIVNLLSLHGIW